MCSLVLLVVLALMLIQTPYFKRQLVKVTVNQLNEILEGTLAIGRIDGNFFSRLSIHDVAWVNNGDTMLTISDVYVQYRLLSLLSGAVDVKTIELSDPGFYLLQLPDSSWNVQHLVKHFDKKPHDTPDRQSWEIRLKQVNVVDGKLKVTSFYPKLPEKFDSITIDLAFRMKESDLELDIAHLSFIADRPHILLKQLKSKMKMNEHRVELFDLLVQTGENRIEGEGWFDLRDKQNGNLSLHTGPLNVKELQPFWPIDWLKASPVISLDAGLNNSVTTLNFVLTEKSQSVDVQLVASNLPKYVFESKTEGISYVITGLFNRIDLQEWILNPPVDLWIDGTMKVIGSGILPESLQAKASGSFNNMRVNKKPVDVFTFGLDYHKGNVGGELLINGDFGTVQLNPVVRDLISVPSYEVDLILKNLDPSLITGDPPHQARINLQASVDGRGIVPSQVSAHSVVFLHPSKIGSFSIDTLQAQMSYANERLAVDTLWVQTPSVWAGVTGDYHKLTGADLHFDLLMANANELKLFLDDPKIRASGRVSGNVSGHPDDFRVSIMAEVDSILYQDVEIGAVRMMASGALSPNDTSGIVSAALSNIHYQQYVIDSLVVDVDGFLNDFSMAIKAMGEEFKTSARGRFEKNEHILVHLKDFSLDAKGEQWQLKDSTALFKIEPNRYEVSDFEFVSGAGDSLQRVFANGMIDRKGNQNFELKLSGINLEKLGAVFMPSLPVKGNFNLDVSLQGSAPSPELLGHFDIGNARIDTFSAAKFDGGFSYLNHKFSANAELIPTHGGRINADGSIPLVMALDSMNVSVDELKNSPIQVSAVIDSFPLVVLGNFFKADDLGGILKGEVKVGGSIVHPEPEGSIAIDKGKLEIKEWGINYQMMQMGVHFSKEMLAVDTLLIRSRDGYLSAGGKAELGDELYKGQIGKSNLKMRLNRFNLVNHEHYNLQLTGNVDVQGSTDSLLFSGDVAVPRSYFYLPAVMRLFGTISTPSITKPHLVAALEKEVEVPYTAAENHIVDTLRIPLPEMSYLNKVKGQLKINIPRNTWIKNDDMRVELSGDLYAFKHSSNFELFGTIDVVRGQYELLGKTFVIERGSVNFQGGEDMNPVLDLVAAYTLRDPDRTEHKLEVYVKGMALSPEISFSYAGENISEGDAISYILFGTNLDALNSGQQVALSGGSSTDPLQSVASSILASQLTRILGNTFNVDYVEVKSSGAFDNAHLSVGKYITPKLFVSYERYFGNTNEKDKNLSDYEVKMEYELFKFLFLQLSSSPLRNGLDVIFKLYSK
jgi:translocation and assembly module TamB